MVEQYPVLYKRTATGAVQRWHQELDGNKYRTVSGQMDGKLVESEWTVCSGKNIGRANETTPEEQAQSEVESHYKKKLAQGGYHENIDDIDKPKFFKPMLAKNYEDYPLKDEHLEKDNFYSQGKLDGVRAIVDEAGMWSRQGKPILSVPHVREALEPLFEVDPNLILDGELYASKFAEDFNQIVSLARKTKPTQQDLEKSKAIQYWVYDLPGDEPFEERFEYLRAMVEELNSEHVVLVETTRIESTDHVAELFEHYVSNGLEGQIVRKGSAPYENKRSKTLLKKKDFIDEEFEIVDIKEGVGNRSGMAGYVTYRMKDGKTFDSNIRGGFEYYRYLLVNAEKFRGGQGTVRYFSLTPDGIPRFPVTVALYENGRDI